MILPNTDSEQSCVVAERIRTTIESHSIAIKDKFYPPLTVSMGIAELVEEDDFSSLIKAADDALYKAKQTGRNRVVVDRENG